MTTLPDPPDVFPWWGPPPQTERVVPSRVQRHAQSLDNKMTAVGRVAFRIILVLAGIMAGVMLSLAAAVILGS